ncbi:hypothetical protein ACOTWV_08750 [Aliarcobacter butzleri]
MVSKITATIESVPIWGDENFDANVHENFKKLKELGPQLNKTVDEINQTFEDIDTYTKTASTKAGEAAQSASTANSAKQTATQQAEIATTKAGEAAQSASTANSAKQTATQQAEIATIKAGEVNDIKNEMIGVVEDLQLDPLSIIASQELAKKLNISDTQDLLTSNDTTKPLSANQGRVLKEFIDAINEILSSDDTTLDELQEIVSFIKQNKSTLDNLSVNNIAGLEEALSNLGTLPIGLPLVSYEIYPNCVVAFGGEFNRADYPKLWAWLQGKAFLKTEAQWQAEATANSGICGFYSSGNGTTTFRVPNLDKAFLRPDSRGVGSYQGDAIRNITGSFTTINNTNLANGAFENIASYAGNFPGTYNFQKDIYFDTSRVVPTANENRPKNIAVLPLIVAK